MEQQLWACVELPEVLPSVLCTVQLRIPLCEQHGSSSAASGYQSLVRQEANVSVAIQRRHPRHPNQPLRSKVVEARVSSWVAVVVVGR